MNNLEKYLSVVEEIISTQTEKECRRNVLETIGILKNKYPLEEERIQELFENMCKKHNKDFYKDIKVKNT